MKKKIAILGSTGSIGKSLLNIVNKDKKKFEITLLTANNNYKELIKQTKKFKVKNVIIINKNSFNKFKKINKNKSLKVYNNFDEFNKIFKKKIDYSMVSIIGIHGLDPAIKIIKYTKTIAIANKESIICGWNLIKKNLDKYKTKFVPIDSEHFSIWYAIKNMDHSQIEKIFLTASGGPFLKTPITKLKDVKMESVLKHPNWQMGKKITVDSSNMINKVFEVLEAKNIFNLNLEKLSILIHPKSYVHAIIVLKDGMLNVIAHDTTMEIPIFNSIYQNKKPYFKKTQINLKNLNNLNLEKVNYKKFNSIKILNLIPSKISLFETVLVSANDELVKSYLNKEITYTSIVTRLNKILNRKEFKSLKKISPKKISDIMSLDKYVRLKIKSKSV